MGKIEANSKILKAEFLPTEKIAEIEEHPEEYFNYNFNLKSFKLRIVQELLERQRIHYSRIELL